MRILLLILLMGFSVPMAKAQSQPQNTMLLESQEQAHRYIRNIRQGINVTENIWALAALTGANRETRNYISRYLQGSQTEGTAGELLSTFRDTSLTYGQRLRDTALKLNAPALLIAYFLDESDSLRKESAFSEFQFSSGPTGADYRALARHLLDGEPINREILPVDDVSLVHFLLFYYTAGRAIMPRNYMETVASVSPNGSNSPPTLSGTLRIMSVFQAQYNTDQYAQAQEIYALLSDVSHFPNSKFKMFIFSFLDYSLYLTGYADRSLEIVRNYALPLAAFIGRSDILLEKNIYRGIYLYEIGKIQEAQEAYLGVMEDAEEMGAQLPQSIFYNNLAITHLKMGNFDQYLNLQFQALGSINQEEDYAHHFTILENLFNHYRNTNNVESALTYLGQARELADKNHNIEDLAWVDLYTGMVYRDFRNNYTLAQAYMDTAYSLIAQSENYTLQQALHSEQANLYLKQNMYNLALSVQDTIISLAEEVGERQNLIEGYISKARIYLEQDDLGQAGPYINRYDTLDLTVLNFEQLVEAKTVKASYLYRSGDPAEAYTILDPLITQVVNWVHGSTELQTGFWNVAPEFLEAFRLTANLLIETGRPEEAVQVLDQLKSINDANLYQNPMVRSSILTESELTQYQKLSNQLDQLRRRMLASESATQSQIQQQIDELTAQKRIFDRRLSSVTNHSPVSVNFVQSRLDAYERVLHITELEDRYYIASISRTDISFRTVPLDSANRDLFESSVRQIANKQTNLQNLYRISSLMGFDEINASVDRLTVIPDSYLYQLPLDILPVTEPESSYSYGGARYLIEDMEVRYLTSLNDFRPPERARAEHRTGYAGYGISTFEHYEDSRLVPLPYARREVENISNTLTNLDERHAYYDEASTEEVFKATAPSARILHLATHSQVSDQDPLFSRIFMSRSGDDESEQFPGQIFAYELFELNLNNDLIMLNSCESGSGSYLQGSGVMGISRALRYAGAKTLVLNLWSVNDMMASEFALQFYQGLNKGMSKSEALRNAKLYFLKNKNANPHFWGPYMLIGDNEPAVRPYRAWNYLMAGSFIAYFLIFVTGSLFFRYRNRQQD